MSVERLVNLKQVTQPEPCKHSKSHAEKKQVAKVKCHLPHYFEPYLNQFYVNYPPVSSSFRFDIVPNKMIATASLIIPYPKSTAFNTGNFYG